MMVSTATEEVTLEAGMEREQGAVGVVMVQYGNGEQPELHGLEHESLAYLKLVLI